VKAKAWIYSKSLCLDFKSQLCPNKVVA
jgi:hypothetical protein